MPENSEHQAPLEDEFYSSWALLIYLSLMLLILWISYFLKRKEVRMIHESVVSIFVGMLVGLVIRFGPTTTLRNLMTFDSGFFLNLILPPIILNSGYELKRNRFFRHIGTILIFALLGTFTTALVIGGFTYMITLTGVENIVLSLNECFMFGSVLSATDPVTVLAIFSQLKVDPKLFTLIFGESIMNDAVSIVLFETLRKYHGSEMYFSNVVLGIGTFMFIFLSSLFVGVGVGMLCALQLKFTELRRYPATESCIVIIVAYSSYFLANGIEISGIVSLLFTGISLKHYAYDNMSIKTRRTTKYIFHILCQLSENFIFIYLGVSMFTHENDVYKPFFIICTVIIMCIARYFAIFPYSRIINFGSRHLLKKPSPAIAKNHQFMLFWAGLRGAVSVVLAIGMVEYGGTVVRTTTIVVVIVSVVLFGGTTPLMLKKLDISTGVEDDDEDESSDEDFEQPMTYYERRGRKKKKKARQNRRSNTAWFEDDEEEFFEEDSLLDEEREPSPPPLPQDSHWFTSFDNRTLKPFLTRPGELSLPRDIDRPASPNLSIENGDEGYSLVGLGQQNTFRRSRTRRN
ncbi:sodium/hydrogen exchanger [Basidiobolus meristosporus CBS 931.73]|uniref:Sodium/hydrogen exchanger n=1 Tax=Basidiobolus meristosporus CBS 931.73 TaxID=1314790 RepID=A0A1Y1YWK3_9FUNG|nr:sodium/hydrogen exchanger [Basidiobolus meristosporus CBS 931.73]|eukprot:ORY02316.1 sodium/hydrogen exchanger [Basidiobolus meristosporus CBS 931.73]